MKLSRPLLFLIACTLSVAAAAQWQWVDKTGRKVYSDRPPPADVPEKSILKQPAGARSTAAAAPASPAPAASGALAAASASTRTAASAPRLSGKDAELEAKKKQAEQEEAAKKKAADEKLAADRAQNCERAKGTLKMLQSGRRMQQTNAQGEPEVMTDETRAAETRRTQEIMAQDCGAVSSR